MISIIRTFFIFIVTMMQLSCIREVKDIDLPQPDQVKLVVGCFISPQDSVISATITKSHSPYGFFDTGYPVVQDARVELSDGVENESFTFSTKDSLYLLAPQKIKITGGKQYFLTVEAPG